MHLPISRRRHSSGPPILLTVSAPLALFTRRLASVNPDCFHGICKHKAQTHPVTRHKSESPLLSQRCHSGSQLVLLPHDRDSRATATISFRDPFLTEARSHISSHFVNSNDVDDQRNTQSLPRSPSHPRGSRAAHVSAQNANIWLGYRELLRFYLTGPTTSYQRTTVF